MLILFPKLIFLFKYFKLFPIQTPALASSYCRSIFQFFLSVSFIVFCQFASCSLNPLRLSSSISVFSSSPLPNSIMFKKPFDVKCSRKKGFKCYLCLWNIKWVRKLGKRIFSPKSPKHHCFRIKTGHLKLYQGSTAITCEKPLLWLQQLLVKTSAIWIQ